MTNKTMHKTVDPGGRRSGQTALQHRAYMGPGMSGPKHYCIPRLAASWCVGNSRPLSGRMFHLWRSPLTVSIPPLHS